jgi:hypothetical protein
MGRFVVTISVTALAVLCVTPAGAAKTFPLTFDRTTARPGDRVTAFVPVSSPGVRVFVVDVRAVRDVRRFLPKDPRLIEVGTLAPDSTGFGEGKLTFDVPHVHAGRYAGAVLVQGAFYVTDPAYRSEYGVRRTVVLDVRSGNTGPGRLWAACAFVAAAGLLAYRLRRRM